MLVIYYLLVMLGDIQIMKQAKKELILSLLIMGIMLSVGIAIVTTFTIPEPSNSTTIHNNSTSDDTPASPDLVDGGNWISFIG